MKRTKREKLYPIVKQIKPFFFKTCRFCYQEFKREIGYEIEDLTVVNPRVFWSYCCNDCAKGVDEVVRLVNKSNFRVPPPPLPSKKE